MQSNKSKQCTPTTKWPNIFEWWAYENKQCTPTTKWPNPE